MGVFSIPQYQSILKMFKKRSLILLIDDDVIIDFLHKKLLIKAGIEAPIITRYNGKTALEELVKLNNQLDENDDNKLKQLTHHLIPGLKKKI